MKTPSPSVRRDFPPRFITSSESYLLDLSDLPEDSSETITSANIVMVRGDTVADRIAVVANVLTFRLSGGSRNPTVHQFRIDLTSSTGETDSILESITILG